MNDEKAGAKTGFEQVVVKKMNDNQVSRLKSEKREQRKKLRRIKVHGRRFAELVKNAILKRSKAK